MLFKYIYKGGEKMYINKLPEDAKQVKGALVWVTPNGNFYGKETRTIPSRWNPSIRYPHKHYGEHFQYSTTINNANGYVYVPIKYIIGENNYEVKSRRAHIVIAETFLPNPKNLPIVGHKNNKKDDNRVENLYWTTFQENTQKAVDDGLLVNKKGEEDSQSFPVIMIDTLTNQILASYGSVSEAERSTGCSKTTILNQCKEKPPIRNNRYFRFRDDVDPISKFPIVIQYDFKTDKEIARYVNRSQAGKATGISEKVIGQQCALKRKPQWTKSGFYFMEKNPT